MIVDIPPELADFVRRAIHEGPFRSESEVVGEALRLFERRQRQIHELKQAVEPALERLDRGEGVELNDTSLGEFFTDVKTRGHQRWEAQRDQP